jgi:hypothetical protein
MHGCPNVQLDTGEGKLIAVLDTGADITLMPAGSFEDLLEWG